MQIDRMMQWRIEFHKALSNPERLKIVELLEDGEQCQCDIYPAVGLSQSTVSAYLSQLVRSGILTVKRDGTKKLYQISDKRVRTMIHDLRTLAEEKTVR